MLQCLWDRNLGMFEGHPNKFRRLMYDKESFVQRLEWQQCLRGHSGCVNTCAYSPDGSVLISSGDDLHVLLWDWDVGQERLRYHSGHRENVFSAFQLQQHRSNTILTTAADGQVRYGILGEGGQVETKHMSAHSGGCHSVALDPERADVCYSCGEDGEVLMFDLREPGYLSRRVIQCKERKSRVTIVPLNTINTNPYRTWEVVIAGGDQYARVYDTRTFNTGPRNSTDNSASDSEDGICIEPVYFVAPLHLRSRCPSPRITLAQITCATYSTVGELLVTYSDEKIYLFKPGSSQKNVPLGNEEPKDTGHEDREQDSEKGDHPAHTSDAKSGSQKEEESQVPGFPHSDPREVWQHLEVYLGHRNRRTVKGVSFLGKSEEYVVSGSDCGHIFVWSKMGARLERVLQGDSYIVNCIAPHPSMHLIMATSGIENNVKIWGPTADEALEPGEEVAEIVKRNGDRSTEGLTPWGIAEMLMMQLSRRGNDNDDDDGDDDDDDGGPTRVVTNCSVS